MNHFKTSLIFIFIISITFSETIILQQGSSYTGCTDATIISKDHNGVYGSTTNTGNDQTLGVTYSRYQYN